MREREIELQQEMTEKGRGTMLCKQHANKRTPLMKEAMLICRTTTSLGPCHVQYINTVQVKILLNTGVRPYKAM